MNPIVIKQLQELNNALSIYVKRKTLIARIDKAISSIEKAFPIGHISLHADGTRWKKVSEDKWEQVKEEGEDKKQKPGKENQDKIQNYSVVKPDDFIKALNDNIPEKFKLWVTQYTADEYISKGAKIHLSNDKKSGFAVTDDGDIISVFSSGGGRLGVMMEEAIKAGGNKLDCIGKRLAEKYAKYGFEPVKTEPWNDKYAPEGWDYKINGRPEIFFMKLKKKVKKQEDKAFDWKAAEEREKKFVPEAGRKAMKEYADFIDGSDDEAEEEKE